VAPRLTAPPTAKGKKMPENRRSALEKALEGIAERILSLDEASLTGLWGKYKERMERFDTSREWERAVIAFFLINAVRVKNQIFNEQIQNQRLQHPTPSGDKTSLPTGEKPVLKRVK
jgi:hypothetical protein